MDVIPAQFLTGWDVVALDDEGDSLEVVEIILMQYGATVHTAMDGQDGLALIRKVQPRFVVSDLSMPVMDGWGLIFEMKREALLSDIPVFALTAHAMQGDRERTLSAGFYGYLSKPIEARGFIQDLYDQLKGIPQRVDV